MKKNKNQKRIVYKYTSLESAIKIIKSESVLLNNPTKFNDPYDSNIKINENEKNKAIDIVLNYCVVKEFFNLFLDNKLILTFCQRIIINFLKLEYKMMKFFIKKQPQYKSSPFIYKLINKVLMSNSEAKTHIEKIQNEFKEKLNKEIEEYRKKILISCFSRRKDSILMWSHYADSHRGVCFEYDITKNENFAEVKYSKKKLNLELTTIVEIILGYQFNSHPVDYGNKRLKNKILAPFLLKSIDWSYEEETRCIVMNDNSDLNINFNSENYFYKLPKITKIFIGCKAKGFLVDEIKKLASHRGIPVAFMKESEDDFLIEEDKNYDYKPSEYPVETNITILKIIQEIENDLKNNCYLSAFTLALMIPSQCGEIENPTLNHKDQYIKWLDDYICYKSPKEEDKPQMPYLSGALCYELKESISNFLNFNVNKNQREFTLDNISLRFSKNTLSGGGASITQNSKNSLLTIDMSDFCKKIVYVANNFYLKNQELFLKFPKLNIENYDKKIDDINEFDIIMKNRRK